MRMIAARELSRLLQEKGIVPPHCTRIVIDIGVDEMVKVYYTVYGDERLLEVMQDVNFRIEES